MLIELIRCQWSFYLIRFIVGVDQCSFRGLVRLCAHLHEARVIGSHGKVRIALVRTTVAKQLHKIDRTENGM